MYSTKIANQRIKKVLEIRKIDDVVRYTQKYSLSVRSHLDSLWNYDTKAPSRLLYADEQKFVDNELLVSAHDYTYWCERYAVVKTYDGKIQPYIPNLAQRILNDMCASMEEEGIAIMLQQLKARQLGMSTDNEIRIAHRSIFYPDTNALVASSDPDKTRKMAEMIDRVLDNLPWWMRPEMRRYVSGEVLVEFPQLRSGITIQHGTQMSGIARGDTPQIAHLSEIPDYDNPEELIEASLMNAMHENPYTLLVLESTAKGRSGWWFNKWRYNKANWPSRRSRLCPIFLPWFVGDGVWPTETWVRARRELLKSYEPSPITLEHARSAREYTLSNDLLRKHLGPDWTMPKEQMLFWELSRQEAEQTGTLSKFLEEMPANDEEAFQASGQSIFPVNVITETRNRIRTPEAVVCVTGGDIPERLTLQPLFEKMRDMDSIPITASQGPRTDKVRFDLIPLRFPGYTDCTPDHKLFIYEYPQPHEEYIIGVDLAEGIGQDSTVVTVLRRGTPERVDAQVAEFSSPAFNSHDVLPVVMCLSELYTQQTLDNQRRRPKIVIELACGGDDLQHELRKRGYTHLYERVNLDHKGAISSTSIGWKSTHISKRAMLPRLITAITDGDLQVGSWWFVDEMSTLELDESKRTLKIAAGTGYHDDRIIALGIAYYASVVRDIKGTETSAYRARKQREREDAYYPVWTPDEAEKPTLHPIAEMLE